MNHPTSLLPPSGKPTVTLVIKSLLAATLVGAIIGLAGCNTTEGVGDDIEAAGDALSDAARDAKD